MIRAVVTPMLLLAVLIQAAFGCFWRHSHEPAARDYADDAQAVVSAAHSHHHDHSHHHGGHSHGLSPAHFHFGGESDEEHRHEESGHDVYSYVASRPVAPPVIDVAWVGHTSPDAAVCPGVSVEPTGRRERSDAFGHSSWPSGQRLSLLGVWVI